MNHKFYRFCDFFEIFTKTLAYIFPMDHTDDSVCVVADMYNVSAPYPYGIFFCNFLRYNDSKSWHSPLFLQKMFGRFKEKQ